MADSGKPDPDGVVMAQAITSPPTSDTPYARQETPEDTAAHRRAQQRFPFEFVFFIIATALQCFNLGAHWFFAQEINTYWEESKSFNLSLVANRTALVAQYEALVALDPSNRDKFCDTRYFSNEGFGFLSNNLLSLRDATLAFFYLGIIPSVAFLVYKIGHLRRLWQQRSRSLHESFNPVSNPEVDPIDRPRRNRSNNPLGRVKIGDVSVAGQIRRAERFALRGETSGYMVLQLFHDIPLVMIFFLFIAFAERFRGFECARCMVTQNQVCPVPYYFSISFTDNYILKVAMGACFLHIAWNYVALCFRWIYYFQIFDPPWHFGLQFAAWFLATFCFVMSFVTPVAILFVAYVGPAYYGFESLTGGIVLSAIGGSVWSTGLGSFLWVAGLELGESMFEGLFCCNFCEMCWFAMPCLEYCEETFTICEVCCDNGCCCCC